MSVFNEERYPNTIGGLVTDITGMIYDRGGAVFNVKHPDFDAQGDGATDDTAAIQAAVDAAKTVHGTIYFPPGTYLISTPITVATAVTPFTGIAFVGSVGAFAYNTAKMPAVLKAAADFPTGEAVLDLRYCWQTAVYWLGVDMTLPKQNGCDITGIELGTRTATATLYSNHVIERCSIHDGYYGIRAGAASLLHIRANNVSSNSRVGVYLDGAGDSDLEGNYVNTTNPDFQDADLYTGTGILVTNGAGNTNIRGGKVEWNAKGIVVYGSNGINISGVNFDVNRWHHVFVTPTGAAGTEALGFSITGCRFLAGGSYYQPTLQSGGCAIRVLVDTGRMTAGAITGNTFRKGGDLAYDLNPGPNVGPAQYGIRVEGSGLARVAIAGNDFYQASSYGTLAASGGDIVVAECGNYADLPIETYNGATITHCI
jgi:parallel beta-helix repeat protein